MFARELGLWRPTTQALFGLQWIVGDGAPWLFHWVNLLGHAAVTELVFLVLLELMSGAVALHGALIFTVHPVHVEAVANIVGLSEITSAGFFLGACLLHLRGPAESKWPRAAALGALYAIAFGSKEGAVTPPAVIFLLDAARGRLGWRDLPQYLEERWRAYAAMVIVAGALLLVRWEILGTIANPIGPLGTDLLIDVPRIWTVAEVWGNYARL
ncbi:MAG: hypothetical protein O2992_12045 [Gemmatimonadetes bacterium]|nr:hypothetical protein [Gemmatimonadota bacterium]